MRFTLTYRQQTSIRNRKKGLTEPSGLARTSDGRGFYTVSDDAGRIFRLDRKGKIVGGFRQPRKQLEGLTSEPSGRFLYAVQEGKGRILKLDITKRKVVKHRRLGKMKVAGRITKHFGGKNGNKGLEGIAWNENTGSLFCLKEGKPGLLVEVEPNLKTIRRHRELGPRNGFINPDDKCKEPDYSGIAYDRSRKAFWIVSDRAKRVYLYDAVADRVLDSEPLTYRKNGKRKRLRQAEGVICDPDSKRLYVVTDRGKKKKDVKLVTYDVNSRP